MTPKEKAQELINKMLMYSEFIYDAQKNALIAVDEILNVKSFLKSMPLQDLKYWQEVKQEIEKI